MHGHGCDGPENRVICQSRQMVHSVNSKENLDQPAYKQLDKPNQQAQSITRGILSRHEQGARKQKRMKSPLLRCLVCLMGYTLALIMEISEDDRLQWE